MGILKVNRAVLKSHSCEWATPQKLFDELDKEFKFTLDVAATKFNAKCARFFDQNSNGLAQKWAPARCWMNPPYGLNLKHWMKKAWKESVDEGALVVCLVPSRTDTSWWHNYALEADEIRFLQGRIRFDGGNGGQATFPSCIIIFRGRK